MSDSLQTRSRTTRPLNVSYLVMGLVFLGIAGSWALRAGGVVDTSQMQWLVPLVLVCAGVIGLVAFTARGLRGRETNEAPTSDDWQADADHGGSFDPYPPYAGTERPVATPIHTDTDTAADTDTDETTPIEGDHR
jgi:hypothetical protein